MAYVIGLTGGIASGKTSASDYMAELGFPVIDADLVARQVVEPNSPGLASIRQVFGGDAMTADGQLDRQYLADLIFKHKPARQILEDITHPLIAAEILDQLQSFADEDRVILVVPLMYESGFDRYCDEVWLIRAPRARQVDRLMRRDDLTASEAEDRLAAQMTDRERASRADVIIENTGEIADLHRTIDEVLRERGLSP